MKKVFKKFCAFLATTFTLGACLAGCGDAAFVNGNQLENGAEFANSSSAVQVDTHTVTIDYHQTNKPNATLTVANGTAAEAPATPSYGANTFLGWYCKGQPYNWSTLVTEDITVNAVWRKNYTYTLEQKAGTMALSGGVYTTTQVGALYVDDGADFDDGTVETTVTTVKDSAADSGIVFCVTNAGKSTYWEDTGVSYYFFFISQHGTAYLGKVNNGWTALDERAVAGFDKTVSQTYKLKVVLSGTEARCYVNDKLYLIFSERNFLQGKGVGIRTGGNGVQFSGFSLSGEYAY